MAPLVLMQGLLSPPLPVPQGGGGEPPPGEDEPLFNSSVHTRLISPISFDGFANTAAMLASFDTVEKVAGEQRCTVILNATGARDGGKCMECQWTAGCSGDADGLVEKQLGGTTKTAYVSFWYRLSANFALGCSGLVDHKNIIFDQSSTKRKVFGFGFNGETNVRDGGPQTGQKMLCYNGGDDRFCTGNTYYSIVDGAYPQPFMTCKAKPAAAYQPLTLFTDGSWHRRTFQVSLETADGAGNGTLRQWVDGVLVQDFVGTRSAAGVNGEHSLNSVFTGSTTHWGLAHWPTTLNGGAPNNQSSFYDDLDFYRDT